MTNEQLKAVCNAIILGELSANSPITTYEFQAIHKAVAIAKRKFAIELTTKARQNFKEQVEELAAIIP